MIICKRTFWRNGIILAIIGMTAATLCGSRPCHADFIQTSSSGLYQSTDGKTKVILGNNDGAQGIFIAYLKQGISPQEFNAEKIPSAETSHVFVRFDPSAENGYSEIVIGNQKYRLSGNATLYLNEEGSVSVNIDNTNPYLTITEKGLGKSVDSVLGFYGTTEVVKGSGNVAAILTANQLSGNLARVIQPYVVKDGKLWISGKEVSTPSVGLFVKHEHECLNSSTAILTLSQLQRIQKTKSEAERGSVLDQILKENARLAPTKGHLVLRADAKSPVIMLNIRDKNILDLRAIKNTVSTRKICVLSPIN